MGRWMEALNKEREVILEVAPNFLIVCSKHLPKKNRNEFPILFDLNIHSDKWVDELQILDLNKIAQLNSELSRVYRILNLEEFISEISAERILKHWCTNNYKLKDINDDIIFFISFFDKVLELKLQTKIYL